MMPAHETHAHLFQSEFPFVTPTDTEVERLALPDGRSVPILIQDSARALRYRITIAPGGEVRVIIPRRGSRRRALAFAREQARWIARQVHRMSRRTPRPPQKLGPDDKVLFRGEWTPILFGMDAGAPTLRVGDAAISLGDVGSDFTPAVRQLLMRVAERELPPRLKELASLHGCAIGQIAVRDLKASWGRCQHTRRGSPASARISLNWRLVQAPAAVRDYVMLHELMHTREMNHSPRFWAHVAQAHPGYRDAERWLKESRHRVLA
ncbi:MAG: M48 family metallopeptidase [Verrucomicrobiae bacterium]|nr:M48 family metallopeptidase [Verrucomicrobiae bacterium]